MLEYKEFAKYYDLLYSDLEYEKSSKRIIKLFSEYNKSKGNKLLDVACGTGTHISYLKSEFNCTGIDLSEPMLKQARKKSLDCEFKVGDMKSFKLNKKFDVVTCLFNSINNLGAGKELETTINNFYNHLKKGGLLITEFFHEKEDFVNKFNHLRTYNGENIKIARIGEFKSKNDFILANIHYLISEKGKKIKKTEDVHKLMIFPKEQILSTMKEAGFQTKYLKKGFYGKGLFLGIKN